MHERTRVCGGDAPSSSELRGRLHDCFLPTLARKWLCPSQADIEPQADDEEKRQGQ